MQQKGTEQVEIGFYKQPGKYKAKSQGQKKENRKIHIRLAKPGNEK